MGVPSGISLNQTCRYAALAGRKTLKDATSTDTPTVYIISGWAPPAGL